jgi:hypothetical protein
MGGMNCGWDSGNQGRMNRRLGFQYRQVNLGLRSTCSRTRRSKLPKKGEGIPGQSSLTCASADHFHPSSQQLIPTTIKTSTNKGIVRMHLSEPAQVATLWISSIGRKTEDNRKAIGIQCRIIAIDAPKTASRRLTFRRQALLSKEKLAEGDDIVGRCVGEDVGRKQAGTKCPAQSEADSFINRAQFDGEKVEDGRVRRQIEDGIDALSALSTLRRSP